MSTPDAPPPMLVRYFPPSADALALYIKEVGRGAKGAKDLTRDEARDAMEIILGGRATPAQIGAFFQAMRIKSETPEELAGMIEAARGACPGVVGFPINPRADVIETGVPYDGRLRAFHVLPFAARLAARAGLKVFIHGHAGAGPKFGVGAIEILHAMGLPRPANLGEALERLEADGVAWIDAPAYSPALAALRPLRDEVVLRGPLATAEKMLNLSGAGTLMAGNFHTAYAEIMSGAFAALRPAWGSPATWVIQGPEGHIDIDPRRRMTAKVLDSEANGVGGDGSGNSGAGDGGIGNAGIAQAGNAGGAAARDEMIMPEMFAELGIAREDLAPPDPPLVTNPRDLNQRAAWIAANLKWGAAALRGEEPRGRAALLGTAAALLWAARRAPDFPTALALALELSG